MQAEANSSATAGLGATAIPRDNLATVIAIGLVAYASADIAHHALGHGGACLALGGRIVSLSSVFVDCTIRGTVVDLAGPLANLVVGLAAITGAALYGSTSNSPAPTLLLALVAGFNLLWFCMQMAFSAATMTDDFAWALHESEAGASTRLALVVLGVAGYVVAMRLVAVALASFAPRARVKRLMRVCWLSAGIFACLTATFDPLPTAAILQHAAPQSFILAIGLLIVPALMPRSSGVCASGIELSWSWVVIAIVAVVLSIAFLGPGFAISR